MIPLKTRNVFGKIIQICNSLKLIPYTWDTRKGKAGYLNKKHLLYKTVFVVQFLLAGAYQVFCAWRWFQSMTTKQQSIKSKIKISYNLFLILLNINQIIILRHFGYMHHFINGIFTMFQNFEETSPKATKHPQKRGDGDELAKPLRLAGVVSILSATTRQLTLFKNPMSPLMLTSLWSYHYQDPHKPVPMGLKLLCFFIQVNVNLCTRLTGLFILAVIVIYMFGILKVIKELQACQDIHRIQKWFRQLSVIQNYVNAIYSDWFLVIEVVIIYAIVLSIYQGIICYDPRGAVIAILGIFLSIKIVFGYAAKVFEFSAEAIQRWKKLDKVTVTPIITGAGPGNERVLNLKDNLIVQLYFKKFLRSCRPLRCNLGSCGFADNSMLLTYVMIIICYSANMIITLRP